MPSSIFIHFIITGNLFQSLYSLDCQLNESDPYKVTYTITVDKSGQENFTTIQNAIDSIPSKNTQVDTDPNFFIE